MIRFIPVIVNVAFLLLFAPVVDGVERKVKARLQNRQGPSLFQTWYDLLKLFRRPSTEPMNSVRWLFRITPPLVLASLLLSASVIPSILPFSMNFWGDMILFVYLLSLSSIAITLGGFASRNPYAQIGSHREMSMLMAEEFALAFILAGLAVSAGGLSFTRMFPLPLKVSSIVGILAFAVITYISGSRLPFEVSEAEPEIVEGPLIEFGGRSLGVLKLALYLKRILLITVLLDFFIPSHGPLRSFIYICGVFVLSISYASIEAYFGRFRTRDAVRFLKRFAIMGIICWILAVVGW